MHFVRLGPPLAALALAPFLTFAPLVACSDDAPAPIVGSDAALGDASANPVDGGAPEDAAPPSWTVVDGGYAGPDGSTLPATAFATGVGPVTPGSCGGFGNEQLPGIVLGPPVGGGGNQGSLDVYSLGNGGSIVLSFGDTAGNHAIVDGPGDDFIVFENAFFIGGNPGAIYAEPGEVAVSEDGVTWKALACDGKRPYTNCAGIKPVFAGPTANVSPLDPAVAGGDAFDLAAFGVVRARFVKITDRTTQPCTPGENQATTNGFDLDGIAVLHHD
jgi:hypothetical protein